MKKAPKPVLLLMDEKLVRMLNAYVKVEQTIARDCNSWTGIQQVSVFSFLSEGKEAICDRLVLLFRDQYPPRPLSRKRRRARRR